MKVFIKSHLPTITLIVTILIQGLFLYKGIKDEISTVKIDLVEVKTKLQCHLQPKSCHDTQPAKKKEMNI